MRPTDVGTVGSVVAAPGNVAVILLTGPKTRAGMRDIAIPPHLRPAMVEHMEKWAPRDRFFVGMDGRPMRGNAV